MPGSSGEDRKDAGRTKLRVKALHYRADGYRSGANSLPWLVAPRAAVHGRTYDAVTGNLKPTAPNKATTSMLKH